MFLFLYILFVFLILRFSVTLFNYISNPKLTAAPRTYHDRVTIVRYPGSDQLFRKSLELQQYREVELLKMKTSQLPDLKDISGRYVLFADPGVEMGADLLNNAIHRMKMNRLSMLSVFPTQVFSTLADRVSAPLLHYLLLSLVPLRAIPLLNTPVFSAASRQFILFDAHDFLAGEWEQIPLKNDADAALLMKVVKASGFKTETLLANGHLVNRRYKTIRDAFKEMSTQPFSPFSANATGLVFFLFLLIPGPPLIYYFLNQQLFYFDLTLIVLMRALISLSAGEPVLLNSLLHPVQMLWLLLTSIVCVVKQFRNFALRLFGRKRRSQ